MNLQGMPHWKFTFISNQELVPQTLEFFHFKGLGVGASSNEL